MSQDHERIEELLAGYVLLSLSGEDAIEADRVLSEHVPSCPMCRDALAGFRSVEGELGLAPRAVAPTDLLLPRIRRELEERRRPHRRTSSGALVAVATSVAALVGMAALSMSLGTRATRAETQRDLALRFVDAISQPGAAPVSLESGTNTTPRMVEVTGPTLERMIVLGRDVPQPAANFVYVIWLGSETGLRPVREFAPDEFGFVYVAFEVDRSSFDRIVITEEPLGATPDTPATDSAHVWQASL